MPRRLRRSCLPSLLPLAIAFAALLAMPALASAATFYVSPSGSDRAAGTSTAAPWASIARVNSQNLEPGDAVRFAGGAVFAGNLTLDATDSGTAAAPVTIGSYGTGRATISGGGTRAIFAWKTAGLVVEDLNVVGNGATVNRVPGILLYNDGSKLLGPVTVRRVDVSGYGDGGLSIGAWYTANGYSGVTVDHVNSHDNGKAGIMVWGQSPKSHRNVDIGWCGTWSNRGYPGATDAAGNGIVLGSTDGGRIHHSVAFNNGGLDNNPDMGPAGIWTYDSNAIRIDYNESYENHTGTTVDGDGFDLDVNVTNSIVTQNYAHGNDGPGYLWSNNANRSDVTGNVFSRNISHDDSRKLALGSILLYRRAPGLRVEQNTIIAGNAPAIALLDPSSATGDALIRNNILIAAGSKSFVNMLGSKVVPGARLNGNDYFALGTWKLDWAGKSYGSLGAWRTATTQEALVGLPTGRDVDPWLTSLAAPRTLNDPSLLSQLGEYRLRAGSPVIDAGVTLPVLPSLTWDFFGAPIGITLPDVGAAELQ